MSTAADPICDRTDLPRSMCSHCRGLGWEPVDVAGQLGDHGAPGLREYRDPEADARVGFTMPASYDSTCPGCADLIRAGDRITHRDGRYVCADCASEPS